MRSLSTQSISRTLISEHSWLFPALLSTAGMAMLVMRMLFTGQILFLFYAWNLFLAWIPIGALWMAGSSGNKVIRALWYLLWLLFLPNAAYLVTDLMHIDPDRGMIFWADLIMGLLFAMAGLSISILSIEQVASRLRRGQTLFSLIVIILVSTGVYIGRILRWNSWDAVLRPLDILFELTRILHTPGDRFHLLSFTALFVILHLIFNPLFGDKETRSSLLSRPKHH